MVNGEEFRIGRIPAALAAVQQLAAAGLEILEGQLGQRGLEPISIEAGRLLFEAGVVGTVNEGVVLFHERIGRNKPNLRRILRLQDRRAGRIGPARARTLAQKAVIQALKAGQVRREKGKIVGFTPMARRAIAAAKRKSVEDATQVRNRRQKTALAKLQGIGGSRGRKVRK